MKVIVKKPDDMGNVVEVNNELEDLQRLVGGYIEVVQIDDFAKPFVIICDEEGKLKGKEPNIPCYEDYLVGDIVVCGVEGGEFTDVPFDLDFWQFVMFFLAVYKKEA